MSISNHTIVRIKEGAFEGQLAKVERIVIADFSADPELGIYTIVHTQLLLDDMRVPFFPHQITEHTNEAQHIETFERMSDTNVYSFELTKACLECDQAIGQGIYCQSCIFKMRSKSIQPKRIAA